MGWSAYEENGVELRVTVKGETTPLVGGDPAWDICGVAIAEMRKAWKEEWHREPTRFELEEAFQFALGGIEKKLTPFKTKPEKP